MALFSLSAFSGAPRRGFAATAAGSLLGALTLVAVLTMRFTGTEESSLATSFVIDDTSLTTG